MAKWPEVLDLYNYLWGITKSWHIHTSIMLVIWIFNPYDQTLNENILTYPQISIASLS